jgi:hypothetical protein
VKRPKLSLTRSVKLCVKLRPKLSLTRECEVVCVKLRPKLSLTRECDCVCETASQTESDKGV